MACGLPVVAADSAGSTDDLVAPAVTGFVYPAAQVETLAERLVEVAADPELRRRMGQAGLARIRRFTYRTALVGLTTAIRAAAAGSANRAGVPVGQC